MTFTAAEEAAFFVNGLMGNTAKLGRVLCCGVLGVDQLVQIAHFPERDGHTRVFHDEEFIGGEAANTATILSDLGVEVRLMGNALGDDRRGAFFLNRIANFPVDISGIQVDANAQTGHAIVLSDSGGARSICGCFPDLRTRPVTATDLAGIALLSVDPFLGEHAVGAAALARQMGAAVFSIELAPDHALASLCDVVINSTGFMRRHDMGSPSDVAIDLLKAGVETVVITQGASGCRVFQDTGHSFEQSAFPVAVADTTGAGDGFRAGLIFGYLSGWTLTRSVQFATASGALATTQLGGGGHGFCVADVARLASIT
jgi:sugar/nucleoside kinase (ribokinase family)